MMLTMKTLLIFHMWIGSGVLSRSASQTGMYHIAQAKFCKRSMADYPKNKRVPKSILIFYSCRM